MSYRKHGKPQYRARQQPLLPRFLIGSGVKTIPPDRIINRRARIKATGKIVKVVDYGPAWNPRYWVKVDCGRGYHGLDASELEFLE